jgi:U5 small nuclear ribonucleoprotein component
MLTFFLENAVILHEDKKYFPSAEEVYPDAETLVQDEDTQALDKPIIEPIKIKKFEIQEKDLPETTYTKQYVYIESLILNCTRWLVELAQHPENIRNIAIVGHLHHGKTSFVDMLVEQTHPSLKDVKRNV